MPPQLIPYIPHFMPPLYPPGLIQPALPLHPPLGKGPDLGHGRRVLEPGLVVGVQRPGCDCQGLKEGIFRGVRERVGRGGAGQSVRTL